MDADLHLDRFLRRARIRAAMRGEAATAPALRRIRAALAPRWTLPEDYDYLLRRVDGLSWAGLVLYGTQPVKDGFATLPGLDTVNSVLRDPGLPEDVLVVGDIDELLIGHDGRAYALFDISTFQRTQSFRRLSDLLEHLFAND